jgi:ubiquinone/menaquinone biosynthesis C-methylase UbiE
MDGKDCRSTKDTVNVHYDRQWESYSEKDILERVKNISSVTDVIISQVDLKDDCRILDIGCGPAIIPLRILQTQEIVLDIHGLDISLAAISSGQKLLGKHKLNNVHLILGDCENLPYFSETFDYIVSNATFNLLLDKQRGFSEMSRILRNGGKLVLGDCIAKEKSCQSEQDNNLWSQCIAGAPTRDEVLKYARAVGLKEMETFNITQKVRELVTLGLWSWPEFLEHDLIYNIFSFKLQP